MEFDLEKLRKEFLLNDEEFEKYYNETIKKLIQGKNKSNDKRIIIVGGQSGAGKSRLIPVANEEMSNNGVSVDFDVLRSYHPNFKKISEEYVEKTHIILHPDVEKVKNRILKYLRDHEYDVIYEGSLRNSKGYIEFINEFVEAGYKTELFVMAVPELESFGSTYTRYANDLLTNNNPRWVEKIAHDESYRGVLKTVKDFEDNKILDSTKVFIRGERKPIEIYSTAGKQFTSTNEAIQYGRKIKKQQAIEDFWKKYQYVYTVFKKRKPELMYTLKDWEELFIKEKKEINKGKEERE